MPAAAQKAQAQETADQLSDCLSLTRHANLASFSWRPCTNILGYFLLDHPSRDAKRSDLLLQQTTIGPHIMHNDIQSILLDRTRIAQRVAELGKQIAGDLENLADHPTDVVLVPILTGSIVFLADLIRHLPQKLRIGVISVSSYPGKSMTSKGVSIRSALPPSLAGRHVVIIDDILDSGQTIAMVREIIQEQEPASVWACVLLRKDRPEAMTVPVEYVGFDIPDEFVVGYGLDYDDYYRNLPDIVTLRKEAL